MSRTRGTLWLADDFGQLANKLFVAANLIALAEEEHLRVVLPAFHPYRIYFEGTRRGLLVTYPGGFAINLPPGSKVFWAWCKLQGLWDARLWRHVYSDAHLRKIAVKGVFLDLGWDYFVNLDDPVVRARFVTGRRLFTRAWQMRGYRLMEKHRGALLRYFAPSPFMRQIIEPALSGLRDGVDVLVGVHLRRGDYRVFNNGRWYYEDDDYARYMDRVVALHPGQRVRFVVCSNEPIPNGFHQRFDVRPGPGHHVGDLFALSECDLIMGPPSTYSAWAAVYGGRRLFVIKDRDYPLVDLAAFAPFQSVELLYTDVPVSSETRTAFR